MKCFRKSVLILLAFCIFIGCFAGCGRSDDENAEKSNILFTSDDISLLGNDYKIVHAETVNENISGACSSLFKGLKTKGYTLKNVDDETAESDYEILVGQTNREASSKAEEYLIKNSSGRGGCWLIASAGGKIVIVGINDSAVASAVEFFVENYANDKIEGGIYKLFDDSESFSDIEILGTKKLYNVKLVRPIYNVSYITQTETDKLQSYIAEVTGYCLELVDDSIASKTGNRTDGSGTLTKSEENEYEIVVGNCDRVGVNKNLGRDEYEIRIEEKRIFLNGGSPYATAMAVTEFAEIVKSNDKITPLMSVANGDYKTALKKQDAAEYYKPTWCDNFDEEINYDLWNVRWDASSGYAAEDGDKPSKRGSSTLLNNYVLNGCLYQEGVEDEKAYYGGMFDTKTLMNYQYGYIELSDIQPKGSGYWTALWTNSEPTTWEEYKDSLYFSEVDVNECTDGAGTWTYGVIWAWPTAFGRTAMKLKTDEKGTVSIYDKKVSEDDRGLYLDFHTYGFEWIDNSKVRFTVDGYVKLEFEYDNPELLTSMAQPEYLRLSLATAAKGRKMTTDEDELYKYNKFIIDWVYIFQKSDQKIFKHTNDGWKEYKWLDY